MTQQSTTWGGGAAGSSGGERVGPRWLRNTALPLFLILVCPPFSLVVWYTHVHLGGSLTALLERISSLGLLQTLALIVGPVWLGSATAWKIIGAFAAVQLLLLRFVPGPTVNGPVTATGHTPVYVENGFACFMITLGLFLTGSYGLHLFSPALVYDHLGELIGGLNSFSLLFCLLLYFKGRFAPSTADSGVSGNFIFDYYWGTELYPNIFGWDVKRFTNCRFGMMGWPLLLLSYAAKQQELYGLSDSMMVAVGIQLVYIAKFFHWETGYLRTLDMLKEYGWSPSRCIPHGGHQMSLAIAAGLGLGGNESYPDLFQPYGGFPDGVRVENGYVTLPSLPGIGFEGKSDLIAEMHALAK